MTCTASLCHTANRYHCHGDDSTVTLYSSSATNWSGKECHPDLQMMYFHKTKRIYGALELCRLWHVGVGFALGPLWESSLLQYITVALGDCSIRVFSYGAKTM